MGFIRVGLSSLIRYYYKPRDVPANTLLACNNHRRSILTIREVDRILMIYGSLSSAVLHFTTQRI